MRSLLVAACLTVLLGFTGCESADMPSRVRERFQAPQPQVRTYEMGQREVFDATVAALKQMDFKVVRARAAQGTVQALSRIQPGDAFGTGRQYAFEVEVHSVEPNRTQVSVVLREQEESASFAGATDIPVRTHGLYDSLFSRIADVLSRRVSAPPAP